VTARCPSELALERHLLEPQASPVREHVAGCARCAARLGEMRREGEDFHRDVFPATLAAIEAAARPAWRGPLGRWLVLGSALAAVAGAVVVLRMAAAPDDHIDATTGIGMAVRVQDAGAARTVRDGDTVGAGAQLHVRVRTAAGCRLWILALDAAGEVSRLYPGEGTGGAAVLGEVELPVTVTLGGRAGPERLYAVCTPGPSRWRALAPQLKGGTGSGDDLVRTPPDVARLPPGTMLASVLLEKRTSSRPAPGTPGPPR
jgi:hypothetical protein